MAANRRRTDVPDGLWGGSADRLSDHPTSPDRVRSDRGRDSLLPGDTGRRRLGRPPVPGEPHPSLPVDLSRPAARSGLPLPPVPVTPRPALPPLRGGVASEGPDTPLLTGRTPDRSARLTSGVVVEEARPGRGWDEDDRSAPWSTGPAAPGLSRPDVRVPLPRSVQESAVAGTGSSAYGDWTRPSRTPAEDRLQKAPLEAAKAALPMQVLTGPATTAIPERGVADRRGAAGTSPDDDLRGDGSVDDPLIDEDVPPAAPPGTRNTGPVGGRAALRAQRQAADAERRKATKQGNKSALAVLEEEENPGRRRPRRLVVALVAMTVLALSVLGVYSFVSPQPQEAASAKSGTAATEPAQPPALPTPLPALETEVPVEAVPVAPVRVPVTVLNATDINGLAGAIAGAVKAGGWETPGVGAYTQTDVASTTVFFTEGDENQRQAAIQLVDQFPELAGPAPRFFEVPDVAAPGLVVVATGDWTP